MKKIITSLLLTLTFVFSSASSSLSIEERHWVTVKADSNGKELPIPMDLPLMLVSSHKTPLFESASNGLGHVYNHGWVQPEFEEAVFSRENLEILEIGTASGNVLLNLFKDPRNETMPFRYTCVEIDKSMEKRVLAIKKEHSKNPKNWIGWANSGDIREYIKVKPEIKQNKYDFIYCAQVFHFLNPLEQLECFQALYSFLKPGGKFYFMQNSIHSVDMWLYKDVIKDSYDCITRYASKYEAERKKDNVWAGYNICWELEESCKEGIFPTFHGATTLKPLLSDIGFDLIDCADFCELTKGEKGSSARIGAIAQKTDAKKPNLERMLFHLKTAKMVVYSREFGKLCVTLPEERQQQLISSIQSFPPDKRIEVMERILKGQL